MERKRNTGRWLLWVCFLVYCALMLWLLFSREQYPVEGDYWERMRRNVNLMPFATVRLYLRVLAEPALAYLIPHAVVNLAGNVVMFVPLGFFLPTVLPKLRKWWKTVLCTVLMVTVIELVQLFTLLGSCDVDDLMLNVAGAWLGYGLWRIAGRFRK